MKSYTKIFFVTSIILAFCLQDGIGQRKKKRPSKNIDPEKLTLIELTKGKNKYPISYLRGVKKDSILLYTSVLHTDKKSSYVKKSVLLEDFDYIKITNKKERLKKSLLWGLGIGTVSYFVAQNYAENPRIIAGQGALPKAGSTGIIEGLNAGLAGMGIGIIIYNQILHRKISIADQKRQILRKLK